MVTRLRVSLHLWLMLALLAVFLPAPGARAAATGSFSPNNIDFGDQQVGATSPIKTVTLTNTGDAPLQLLYWGFNGSPFGYFQVARTQGGCQIYQGSPPLAPGATCTIGLTYRPPVTGRHSLRFQLYVGAPDRPSVIEVIVSGTGIVPTGVPVLSQDSLWQRFSLQETGSTSPAKIITLTNLGNVPLTIGGISLVDGYPKGSPIGFGQTNTCGAALGAGMSCTISVTFAPSVTEWNQATVRIDDSAMGSPHMVSVYGEGTSPGACFAVEVTGVCMNARFFAYYMAHGELAINGYPLSAVTYQRLGNGNYYQVQYFERVRMEYHREQSDPKYKVQLGQFGRQILAGVANPPTDRAAQKEGYSYFEQTGHNVRPDFMNFWNANGRDDQFGFPLSEEFQEQLSDGNTYTVQYFERARMEWHPEANNGQGGVVLGQFGRQICGSICR